MPESELYLERRKYKRVDTTISVSYKVVSHEIEAEDIKKQAEKIKIESANISLGGIQLLDTRELKPDQIIRLEFNIDGAKEPVITFAEVRWVANDKNIGKYRTGIEFLVLKEEDKKNIEKLIGE